MKATEWRRLASGNNQSYSQGGQGQVVVQSSNSFFPLIDLNSSFDASNNGQVNNPSNAEMRIPINFFASRLSDGQHKTHGFCIVMQPIVIKKS